MQQHTSLINDIIPKTAMPSSTLLCWIEDKKKYNDKKTTISISNTEYLLVKSNAGKTGVDDQINTRKY